MRRTEDSKKRAKKESSKDTPRDSRAKKKELVRSKKVSEPRDRTSTGRSSSRSSKGKN